MNDLELLDAAFEPAAPDPAARAIARATLVGALAVAASARVLEHAAQTAESAPFTAPRADRWIYTLDAGREQWKRVDGRAWAIRNDRGEVQVEITRGKPRAPFDGYEQQAALPTDPRALLDWAYAQTDSITGAGTIADAEVYAVFRGLLGAGVLPPGLAAGVYRAMKDVPGVTITREDGLIAVTLTDGGLRQSLLLNASSYAYASQRSVKVGPTSKPGDGGTSMRVKAGIVDRPGERP